MAEAERVTVQFYLDLRGIVRIETTRQRAQELIRLEKEDGAVPAEMAISDWSEILNDLDGEAIDIEIVTLKKSQAK